MKKYNKSFNREAINYDEIRPGYPKELYDDIKRKVQFKKLDKILEIGIGTGIATKDLAKFNLDILALEPGEDLIKIAKERLKEYNNIKYLCDIFENVNFKMDSFDYIIAATSFHWLKGEGELDKFKRSYNLLKENGKLIVFWNTFIIKEDNLEKEIDLVYNEIFSNGNKEKENKDSKEKRLDKVIKREKELFNNNYFYISYLNRYVVEYTYNSDGYLKLLNTYPDVINLKKEKKELFLNKIKNIILKNNNKIIVKVITNLYILDKKENFYKYKEKI